MRGIVDRVEAGFAVCRMEDGTMKDLPLSAFQAPPPSGTVFEYEEGAASLCEEETQERKRATQSLFDRLKNRKGEPG